jgi:hypothetical protein
MSADALREDRHGGRACEDDTDPVVRRAVQQVCHGPSSERIGECASGSCRLIGQDETANDDALDWRIE